MLADLQYVIKSTQHLVGGPFALIPASVCSSAEMFVSSLQQSLH